MPEITCPTCGHKHDVEEIAYAISKSTGKMVVVGGQILAETEKLRNEDLQPHVGYVAYCDKSGEYFAIGKSKVRMKADELSDKVIEF